jgi:hypothetical protein
MCYGMTVTCGNVSIFFFQILISVFFYHIYIYMVEKICVMERRYHVVVFRYLASIF